MIIVFKILNNRSIAVIFLLVCISYSSLLAQEIKNPVIRGDWSDPAMLKVDNDYYCLRSTFGWQPGLSLMHSKDLVHWEYVANVDTEPVSLIKPGETLNGVWGAEFGYNPNTGQFLIYAPVKAGEKPGIHVFCADSAEGPYRHIGWISDMIDPGFFVDEDSAIYYTNSSGIIYLLSADGFSIKKEVGRRPDINDRVSGEGPELLKKDGWYYYICSSGGTCPYEYHKIHSFRAHSLNGPWEADPENPVKYAPHLTKADLQGPGHGELVKTQSGEWYLSYHVYELNYETLGRQTCLEAVKWSEDGWWRPANGKIPPTSILKPDLPERNYTLQESDDFNNDELGLQWFFHTRPDYSGEAWSLSEREGFLRIRSSKKPAELTEKLERFFLQRMTRKEFSITTKLQFVPESDGMAGLLLYNDPQNYVLFGVTSSEDSIAVEVRTRFGIFDYSADFFKRESSKGVDKIFAKIIEKPSDAYYLKINIVDPETAYFYFSADGDKWTEVKGLAPMFIGKGGIPDLGWKCGRWTGAAMGVFFLNYSEDSNAFADFDNFIVE